MIGRMRGIKPQLWQHGDLYDLELASRLPLRLAFVGLFCWTDREGRFEWNPRTLKLNILPYDDVDFADVLAALVSGGFVIHYEVAGRHYGWIPTFTKHQSINARESQSDLPAPPREITGAATADAEMKGGFHIYQKGGNGFIYVALAEQSRCIKIGFAERDPQQRIDALCTASPEPVVLIDTILAPRSKETELHNALKSDRAHREWYQIVPAVLNVLKAAGFTKAPHVLDAWVTRESRVTAEVKGSELKRSEQQQDHSSTSEQQAEQSAEAQELERSTGSQNAQNPAQIDAGATIAAQSDSPELQSSADAPERSDAEIARSGEVRDLSELSTKNGKHKIVRSRRDALPALPRKATVQILIDRIGAVSGEIINGTRKRLDAQQRRELLAEMVFAYWAMKTDHTRSIYDEKRARRLVQRLEENDDDVSELFYCVDGALRDDAIQGRMSDNGTKYDGVETIFRDRAQVERLARKIKKYRDSIQHSMVDKYAEAFSQPIDEHGSSGETLNGNESDAGAAAASTAAD